MRGVFHMADIEWLDWADGPDEQTFMMTEGAELSDSDIVQGLKEWLQGRYGHEVVRMTVTRETPQVVSLSDRPRSMSLAEQNAVVAKNLVDLNALTDETPAAEYAAVLERVKLRSATVEAARKR
jgi:hypothetical protein